MYFNASKTKKKRVFLDTISTSADRSVMTLFQH